MLYRRRGTKNYHIQILWKGKLIRVSARTDDKEKAEIREAKLRKELYDAEYLEKKKEPEEPGETILFKDAWAEYIKKEAMLKLSISSQRLVRHSGERFLPFVGQKTLKQIDKKVLSDYEAMRLGQGIKINSVAKELSCIRRCFTICKKRWGYIKESPFSYYEWTPFNDKRVRFYKPGEYEKIIRQAPAYLRPMITLAKETGLRRWNLVNLTWSMIDCDNKLINAPITKNGEPVMIPLTDLAYDTLEALEEDFKKNKVRYLDCPFVFNDKGKQHTPEKISMAFKRACEKAGVKDFRLHDSRHDLATRLSSRNISLYLISGILGHKDARMAQRYAHLQRKAKEEAINSLNNEEIKHSFTHSPENEEDRKVKSA